MKKRGRHCRYVTIEGQENTLTGWAKQLNISVPFFKKIIQSDFFDGTLDSLTAPQLYSKGFDVSTMRDINIEKIPVDLLVVDSSYQRQARSTINKIARAFDPLLFRPIVVNQREGEDVYYIIDGNHRVQAMKIMGFKEIPCEAFYGLTAEQEAHIFANQYSNTTKVSATEIFRANLRVDDPDNIDVSLGFIFDEYKIRIARHQRDAGIRAISVYRHAAQTKGLGVVRRMCELLVGTGFVKTLEGNKRGFAAMFMHAAAAKLELATVIRVLSKYQDNPDKFLFEAMTLYGNAKESNLYKLLLVRVRDDG